MQRQIPLRAVVRAAYVAVIAPVNAVTAAPMAFGAWPGKEVMQEMFFVVADSKDSAPETNKEQRGWQRLFSLFRID